jgi:hypothetical protein
VPRALQGRRFFHKTAQLLADHNSFSDYAGYVECLAEVSQHTYSTCFGTVNWKSKLHGIISLSTMEAELYPAVMTIREAMSMRILLWELENFRRYPGEDKINLQSNQVKSGKLGNHSEITAGRECRIDQEHIAVRDLWIQNMVESGDLVMEYVKSAENPSDLMNKPILGHTLRSHVGMHCMKDKLNMKMELNRQPRENVEQYQNVYLIEMLMDHCE